MDGYARWTQDKSVIRGHYYSDKAPLSSFVVLPFYAALHVLGLHRPPPNRYEGFKAQILGDLLTGVAPFVAIVCLAYAAARSVALAMLPFYGSFIAVYAGAFFGHVLAGFLLLLSYVFLKEKRFAFSGLLAGLAILTEYPLAIAAAAWTVFIFWK